MDTPAHAARVELVETQKTPKPPVEVKKIPEAPRREIRFYPPRFMRGTNIGHGCYWSRPRTGKGGVE